MPRRRGIRLLSAIAIVGLLASSAMGCRTTAFYERELVQDPSMQMDSDLELVYLRNKTEAAREGSLGGYGTAAAGGCGCQ